MKVSVRLFIVAFTLCAVTQCIFQKPAQDNPYDPNCGGASIDSAQSCLKLEVMEVIAPALSFNSTTNQPIDYYFRTTDNCFRQKDGAPKSDKVQPGGAACSLTPHSSKIAALQSVSVSFSVVNCPAQISVDAAGQVTVAPGVINGSCGIKMQVSGAGYRGSSPSSEAIVAVNIGVQQINGGNPVPVSVTSSASCAFNIMTTYDNGTFIQYTDSTFTPMPVTGTWSYSGGGGSVSASGVFTPSGTLGGFTGTVTYTGVTSKNLTVSLNFPVTIADGVYVVPSGSGNGCLGTPAGAVQSAISLASALSPQRTVYVAVGNYTANYQASPISMAEGVSIRGGYNLTFTSRTAVATARSCNASTMSCLIDNNTTSGSRVITIGSSITSATIIDGFYIAGSSMQNGIGASTNIAVLSTGSGTPTIQNNTIYGGAPISGTSSFTIQAISAQSSLNILNNYIIGGTGPATAPGGVTVEGIYSVNGLNGLIANNVIEAGSNMGRNTTYALDITNGCHPTITNNVLISATGAALFNPVYGGSVNPFNAKITNNIFLWGGASTYAIHETQSFGGPRSVENNAFLSLTSATAQIYNRNFATTITTFEAYASFIGGSDKGRGNILLPFSGGMPFVNFPSFIANTSANNTGSNSILLIADGSCTNYTNGQYIEWNGDGVARQISCNAGTNPDQLTVTPSLSSAAANLQGAEIRYWGTNTSNYNPDFHLAQNGQYGAGQANEQLWYNLAYGGKETSQSVCGAPSGGPGTGISGESCGPVSTDKEGGNRTPANVGLANNTNNNGNGTAAVPGGFSMGAYEAP